MSLINFSWEGYVYLMLYYFSDVCQIVQDVLISHMQSISGFITHIFIPSDPS